MSARPDGTTYTLSCDGPGHGITCRNTWHGLPGQDLARCRMVARYDGWLTTYGDTCPDCVKKMLEDK